jgi:hypothetical protein
MVSPRNCRGARSSWKYPKENEYQQYLSANNGHSNAWTAMTSTNYYFDVAPDALEGALDRFAGFFIEPLFNEVSSSEPKDIADSRTLQNGRSRLLILNIRRTFRMTCGQVTLHFGLPGIADHSDSFNWKSIYPKRATHTANSALGITRLYGLSPELTAANQDNS